MQVILAVSAASVKFDVGFTANLFEQAPLVYFSE